MTESQQAVGFKINEKIIHFMGDVETLRLLLSDDDYALDHITRAALSGQLAAYGINSSNVGQMKVSRLPIQEHVDLTAKRNEENIFDREHIEKDEEITELSTPGPDFHFETRYQESLECEFQPGSSILSDITNRSFAEKYCLVWKKNSPDDIQATNLLLDLRASEKYAKLFSDKKSTKQKLWNKIGEEIEKQGFYLGGIIAEKCRQKFANLNKKYVNYLQNSKKTGAAAIEKPEYFDQLHEILHNKHKITPPLIIDSLEENLEIRRDEEGMPRNEEGMPGNEEGMPSDVGTKNKRIREEDVDDFSDNATTSNNNNRYSVNLENKKPKTASYRLMEEIYENQERHNRLQLKIMQSMLKETRKTNVLKGRMIKTINNLLCPPTRKRKRPSK